jgi:hypothetical protein
MFSYFHVLILTMSVCMCNCMIASCTFLCVCAYPGEIPAQAMGTLRTCKTAAQTQVWYQEQDAHRIKSNDRDNGCAPPDID